MFFRVYSIWIIFLHNKMLGFYHKTLITYFFHPKEKNRERFNEIENISTLWASGVLNYTYYKLISIWTVYIFSVHIVNQTRLILKKNINMDSSIKIPFEEIWGTLILDYYKFYNYSYIYKIYKHIWWPTCFAINSLCLLVILGLLKRGVKVYTVQLHTLCKFLIKL